METAQIIWLVLLIFFIAVEALTAAVVSIWFCAGALAALLVSLFWPANMVLQIVVFLGVSTLALLALRPMAKRLTKAGKVPTNADANIGKTCRVIKEIQPDLYGRVELEGLVWTAKANTLLPVGSFARVDDIEGAKLVVSPLPVPPGGRAVSG